MCRNGRRKCFAGQSLPAKSSRISISPSHAARGPQKTPTKLQATIRFDRDVIEYFRGTGRGWQTRVNETLRREVEREKRRAKS